MHRRQKSKILLPLFVIVLFAGIAGIFIAFNILIHRGFEQFGEFAEFNLQRAIDNLLEKTVLSYKSMFSWMNNDETISDIYHILDDTNESKIFYISKIKKRLAEYYNGLDTKVSIDLFNNSNEHMVSLISDPELMLNFNQYPAQNSSFLFGGYYYSNEGTANGYVTVDDNGHIIFYVFSRLVKAGAFKGTIVTGLQSEDSTGLLFKNMLAVPDAMFFVTNSNDEIIYSQIPENLQYEARYYKTELSQLINQDPGRAKLLLQGYTNPLGQKVVGLGVKIPELNIHIYIEYPESLILGDWNSLIFSLMLIVFCIIAAFAGILFWVDALRMKAFDHNPLSYLPGNRTVTEEISKALKRPLNKIVVYCDLDNFKAYNDLYGFSAGDDVILFSAKLLEDAGRHNCFVGHIGGDDFVLIGELEKVLAAVDFIETHFDNKIKEYYTADDRERGFIISKDRMGHEKRFPLVALSMGGLILEQYAGCHPLKIAEVCAEVKKAAKQIAGTKLVMDRRTSAYYTD